jgi:hypothetical protein
VSPVARRLAAAGLRRLGLRVFREDAWQAHLRRRRWLVEELVGWWELAEGASLSPSERRSELLAQLQGTGVSEALYLLEALQRALAAPGDVCEFGVAQGFTSALLASELLDGDRSLWLYDSFQGLSRPTEQDVLLDDILGLGAAERYEHAFAFGAEQRVSG